MYERCVDESSCVVLCPSTGAMAWTQSQIKYFIYSTAVAAAAATVANTAPAALSTYVYIYQYIFVCMRFSSRPVEREADRAAALECANRLKVVIN